MELKVGTKDTNGVSTDTRYGVINHTLSTDKSKSVAKESNPKRYKIMPLYDKAYGFTQPLNYLNLGSYRQLSTEHLLNLTVH